MNKTEAEQLYRAAAADLAKVQSDLSDLKRKESALAKLAESLVELFPSIEPSKADEQSSSGEGHQVALSFDPRGKDAIRRILVERKNPWLSIKNLTVEQQNRGWSTRAANLEEATRTTVFRMYRAKELERRKRSREYVYRLKDLGAPAGKAEAPKPDSLTGGD
jgi:hypothetical protein